MEDEAWRSLYDLGAMFVFDDTREEGQKPAGV
jgi:hypothetical protein